MLKASHMIVELWVSSESRAYYIIAVTSNQSLFPEERRKKCISKAA
jgi:hypothetical protein